MRALIAGVLLCGLAAAAGLGIWNARRSAAAEICRACRRPVHAGSRTVASVGNSRAHFCCPTCALSAHVQTGKPVRLLEVTDFDTDRTLAPDRAFYVKGSDVTLCSGEHGNHVLLDPDMRPPERHFDRCAPSILAFAVRDSAVRFLTAHGGVLLPYDRLAAACTH